MMIQKVAAIVVVAPATLTHKIAARPVKKGIGELVVTHLPSSTRWNEYTVAARRIDPP